MAGRRAVPTLAHVFVCVQQQRVQRAERDVAVVPDRRVFLDEFSGEGERMRHRSSPSKTIREPAAVVVVVRMAGAGAECRRIGAGARHAGQVALVAELEQLV